MPNITLYLAPDKEELYTRVRQRARKNGTSVSKLLIKMLEDYIRTGTCLSCGLDVEPGYYFCPGCGNKIR